MSAAPCVARARARAPRSGAPFARVADGRDVDDVEQLGDVVAHDPVKQDLVAFLKALQVRVPVQVGSLGPYVEQTPLHLRRLREDGGRQQASQVQRVALGLRVRLHASVRTLLRRP